ncbi:MAG: imidazolonepropionase [Acholeplasmataceae bacterium]
MFADRIITHIDHLYTTEDQPPLRKEALARIRVFDDAYIAFKDGLIYDLGTGDHDHLIGERTILHDGRQTIALPGLIDSHTHLVHGGSREDEYERLLEGTPYLDILAAGGGIHGTVERTRKASFEELYQKAFSSLDRMMLYGVTMVEGKSGYGLETKTEFKQLRVMKRLNEVHPVEIIATAMAAHALPRGIDHTAYIESVINDLPRIKQENLATAVDVFCETGVYSLAETKRILTEAKELGFDVKLHADEIDPLGGAGLAVELGASSADHLMAISAQDITAMSKSDTIANLLPGTSFYLDKPYAPARTMIEQGVAVAVSGDYNPGSCPTENFQLIMQLAANKLKMTPIEVLNAVTANAAYHLNAFDRVGSLAVGKRGNVVLMRAPNLSYAFYHFGINHTKDVFIDGVPTVIDQHITRRKEHERTHG